MMTTPLEVRRQMALTQLELFIDVASAWRGRYEDDEWHADINWICTVIPELEVTADYRSGWLCVSGTANPGIGWRLDTRFRIYSLSRSMRGIPFLELTRKQFRDAASRSGVSLPSCHATLYLSENRHE